MTARKAMAIDLALMLVWLSLMVASGVDTWGWGWTAFFAFAAGERWASAAGRRRP